MPVAPRPFFSTQPHLYMCLQNRKSSRYWFKSTFLDWGWKFRILLPLSLRVIAKDAAFVSWEERGKKVSSLKFYFLLSHFYVIYLFLLSQWFSLNQGLGNFFSRAVIFSDGRVQYSKAMLLLYLFRRHCV